MFKPALLATVLLLVPTTLGGLSQSAIGGTPAAQTSGGQPASNTIFSLPPLPPSVTFTTSPNVTVTPQTDPEGADIGFTVSVPTDVLTGATTAGTQASATIATRGVGGEALASLIASLAPLALSAQAAVGGDIPISVTINGQTTTGIITLQNGTAAINSNGTITSLFDLTDGGQLQQITLGGLTVTLE